MTFSGRLWRPRFDVAGEDLEAFVELEVEVEFREPLVEDQAELLMSLEHHRFSVAVPFLLGGRMSGRRMQIG